MEARLWKVGEQSHLTSIWSRVHFLLTYNHFVFCGDSTNIKSGQHAAPTFDQLKAGLLISLLHLATAGLPKESWKHWEPLDLDSRSIEDSNELIEQNTGNGNQLVLQLVGLQPSISPRDGWVHPAATKKKMEGMPSAASMDLWKVKCTGNQVLSHEKWWFPGGFVLRFFDQFWDWVIIPHQTATSWLKKRPYHRLKLK